jgi:regulatory protein
VVADLTARGYLDDAAFARHWVATRAARGYGPARLRAELRARGVAAALIEAALAVAARAAGNDDSELERARAVARRRLPALQRADRARAAGRLRDHLLRRGFAAPMVARVVRECVGLPVEE